MSEIESSKSSQNETTRLAISVGQNIGANNMLFAVLGIYLVVTTGNWQGYGVLLLAAEAVVGGFFSASLVKRGRSKLGAWVLLITNCIAPALAAWIIADFSPVSVAYIIVSTYFIYSYATPKASRRAAFATIIFALLISIAAELIDPPIRMVSQAMLTIAPIFVSILGIVFLVVILLRAWNGNIRARLVSSFLALVILPLATSAIISAVLLRRAAITEVNGNLASITTLKEASINDWTDSMLDLLNIVFHEHEEFDIANNLLLVDSTSPGYDEYRTDTINILNVVLNRTHYFKELFLLDTQGQVILSTDSEQIGKVFTNQPVFHEGLKDIFIQPPTYSQSLGELVIWIGRPLHGQSGESAGVIVGRVDMDILSTIMVQDIGLGETGETYLVRSNHALLTASRFEGYTVGDTYIRTEGATQAIENLASGAEVYTGYRGNDVLGAYRWIPELEVALIAETEQAEALQTTTTSTLTNVGIAVLAAILAVFAAFFVTNTIATPLGELVGAAGKLAAGELEVEVDIDRQDEIGVLAGAFNDMARQLTNLIASLEERVAARTKDQATVAEIATEIATIQDMQEMLEQMVHRTQRGFGLYHAHVFTFDEAKTGEELKIIACGYQEGDEHEGTHGTTSIDYNNQNSIVARCAREQKAVIVNDVHNSSEWLPNPQLPETRAEMALPMIVGGRLMGVLDVQSENLDAFSPEDANVQSTLATQIAVAMQNLMQFEESQKIASDLSVVAEVGIATSTITNQDELLQEIVDLSKESFKLYHAHIYLMNEAGDTLHLSSGAGEVGRTMVAQGLSIPLDREQSLVARAARTQQGVVVNDVTLDANFLPNPLLPETRAEMAVPMVIGGKVIGVLDVQSETVGRFTDLDVNIKTTLASQISVALENARAFKNAQNQALRETKLNTIMQKIQQTDTIEKAMQVAARELGNALGKRKTMVTIASDTLSREQE